jgi:hypothetical protein
MRELVSRIRKLEKAGIQKSEKSIREGTRARDECQRRLEEVKEDGRKVVSEGMMSIEKGKQSVCLSAASTAVQ